MREKQTDVGRWRMDRIYRREVHFGSDAEAEASRWNTTLRALRVLRWYDAT